MLPPTGLSATVHSIEPVSLAAEVVVSQAYYVPSIKIAPSIF